MMEEKLRLLLCGKPRGVGGQRWNGNELSAVGLHPTCGGLDATGDYSAVKRMEGNSMC